MISRIEMRMFEELFVIMITMALCGDGERMKKVESFRDKF
jgi:hypothetical protein